MLLFGINDKALAIAVICCVCVLGGEDVAPDHLPYVVRMEIRFLSSEGEPTRFVHVCTAASVTPTWTLTAAHCVDGYEEIFDKINSMLTFSKPELIIRYVSPLGHPTAEDLFVNITSTHNHPSYKRITIGTKEVLYNDISLLKTKPIHLVQYARLSAADFTTLGGQRAKGVGFGLTYSGGFVASTSILGKTLQVLEVLIRSCGDVGRLGLYPVLCISRRCQEAASSLCSGDSGGPLMHPSGIVGVNSKAIIFDCQLKYIKKSMSSNNVGLITPISPYINWISDQISNNQSM